MGTCSNRHDPQSGTTSARATDRRRYSACTLGVTSASRLRSRCRRSCRTPPSGFVQLTAGEHSGRAIHSPHASFAVRSGAFVGVYGPHASAHDVEVRDSLRDPSIRRVQRKPGGCPDMIGPLGEPCVDVNTGGGPPRHASTSLPLLTTTHTHARSRSSRQFQTPVRWERCRIVATRPSRRLGQVLQRSRRGAAAALKMGAAE